MVYKRRKLWDAANPAGIPLIIGRGEAGARPKDELWPNIRSRLQHTFPSKLEERELACSNLDKAFACHWLDDSNVLVGTKCNALLHVNTRTGSFDTITTRPPRPHRDFSTDNPQWGSCGIHCIAVNPAKDMMVTGGEDPADAVVLRMPDYQPVQSLIGHLDWVFGVAWVSDRHVVTGSRDCTVALWSIDQDGPLVQQKSYNNRTEMRQSGRDRGKVRDIRFSFETNYVAAMCTGGWVQLRSPDRDLMISRQIELPDTQDPVCMDMSTNMLAAGALANICLLDPRRKDAIIGDVRSPDGPNGVRSVCINDNIVSFGTGKGKLCFWDIRTQKVLPTEQPYTMPDSDELIEAPSPQAGVIKKGNYLSLGKGYVDPNSLYTRFFSHVPLSHACYAHAWDPSGTRLFACGGPLAFGMRGSYMGVWE